MNNKTVSIEDYNEVFGHVEYFSSKCNRLEEEMQYMHDFINWMHLGDMYSVIRQIISSRFRQIVWAKIWERML